MNTSTSSKSGNKNTVSQPAKPSKGAPKSEPKMAAAAKVDSTKDVLAAAVEAHKLETEQMTNVETGTSEGETTETETIEVEAPKKAAKTPKMFSVTENDEIVLTPHQKLVQLAQEKALLVFRRSASEGNSTRSAFFKALAQGSNPADAAIDAMIVDTVKFNTDEGGGEVWTDAEDIRAHFIRAFVKSEPTKLVTEETVSE